MLTGDFKKKLSKISPYFRLDTHNAVENKNGQKMCGLYYTDLHVCSCPVPIVPDHDFKKPGGAIDSQGLRTILEVIVKKGCADQTRIERVFGIDLGTLRPDFAAMKLFRENLYQLKRERRIA